MGELPWLWIPAGGDCGCCPEGECSCEHCTTGKMPCCLDLTLTGMVNDRCACCNYLNDTFRVGTGGCNRFGPVNNDPGYLLRCYGWFTCSLTKEGGVYYFTIEATDIDGHLLVATDAKVVWKKAYADKPNCEDWTAEVIPFSSQSGVSMCDATGSSITVSVPPPGQQMKLGATCHTSSGGRCNICRDCTPQYMEANFPSFANNLCLDCAQLNLLSPFVLELDLDNRTNNGWSGWDCRWNLDLTSLDLCGSGNNPNQIQRLMFTVFEVTEPWWEPLPWHGVWCFLEMRYIRPPRNAQTVMWSKVIKWEDWDCNIDLTGMALTINDFAQPRPCDFAYTTVTMNAVFP